MKLPSGIVMPMAFLALAEDARRHESDADRPVWLDRLSADEANLRSAVLWSIEAADPTSRCGWWRAYGGSGRLTAT